ncbi:MAG: helix-turn-helix domain-containing protein, partial [Candidatus Eisenbacteria bacterium]
MRKQPGTTGDLCRALKLSRYAVMGHLSALERAGLVLMRRKGRERRVQPYEALWAHGLLRLQKHVEQTERGSAMSPTKQDAKAYGVETAELEITIVAGVERVWRALV